MPTERDRSAPAPARIRRQVLSGSILVFLAEGLFPVTGIVTAAFLSRTLGAAGYGLLSLSMFLVMWFMLTSGDLFNKSLINTIRNTPDWEPVATRAVHVQLAVSGAMMALVLLVAPLVAAALGTPGLESLLRLVALGIPLHNLAVVFKRILVGRGSYRQRALAGALRSLVRLGLIVALVTLGLSVEGAILGTVGSWLVELLVLGWMARVPILRRSPYRVRQMADYVAPLFFASICTRVFLQADLVLLKGMGGTAAQAGLYAAAQNLSLVPTLLVAAVVPLVLSSVAEMNTAHGRKAAQALARDALRVAILLAPFAALAAGAAPAIVGFIYGPVFVGAGPVLRILLLGALGLLPVHIFTAVLTVAGRPRIVLYIGGSMMLSALVGHWLVIPRFGPVGAAWVTASVACAAGCVVLFLMARLWSVAPPLATLIRASVTAPVAYFAPTVWQAGGAWVLVQLVALVLALGLALVALGELRPGERAWLRSLLSRAHKREGEPV
jgi:O-antigen/teichoic acid export membrane protein